MLHRRARTVVRTYNREASRTVQLPQVAAELCIFAVQSLPLCVKSLTRPLSSRAKEAIAVELDFVDPGTGPRRRRGKGCQLRQEALL